MITNRTITCTNKDGDSLTLTENGFTPFLLVDVKGIYSTDNSVNLMKNTTMDGAAFQSSLADYRNIVLTFQDVSPVRRLEAGSGDVYISSGRITGKTVEIYETVEESTLGTQDYVAHRTLIDKVFKSNELGRLIFREDEEERAIDYYVENIDSTGENPTRIHTVSLICPDPFFYDPNDIIVKIAQIIGDFEFIHEFTEDGQEFGHSMGVYENIYNESANEDIGLNINISCRNDVVNPVIIHIDKNEFIQIGDSSNPFTLAMGDSLLITTGTGNKHIYHIHEGVSTEINYRMADGSSFIQLKRGNNRIGFEAETGKNDMLIEISYRMQYSRA